MPAELAATAAKMLAKNPAERFQQPIEHGQGGCADRIKSAASTPKEKPAAYALSPDPAPSAKTTAPLSRLAGARQPYHGDTGIKNTAANPPHPSDIKTIVPRSSRKAVPTPTMLVKPAESVPMDTSARRPSRIRFPDGGRGGLRIFSNEEAAWVARVRIALTSAVYSRPNPTDVESTQAEAPLDAAKATPLPQASPTPPEAARDVRRYSPAIRGHRRSGIWRPVAPFDAAKAKQFQREWSIKLNKPVDCVVDWVMV